MPIEEIAGGLLRIVGRFIIHLIGAILFEVVFYQLGKAVLRIITFGKYPPPEDHSTALVQVVGLVLVASAVTLYFIETPNQLDLAKELPEKELGALVTRPQGSGNTPVDEAAEILIETLQDQR